MTNFVRRPLADRFWEKVEKTDGCWLWRGADNGRGYGEVWDGARKRKATHVALELAGRPLSPGEMACHRCDQPLCVRPDHLFGGTARENVADCVRKGRHGSVTKPWAQVRGDRTGARLHPERLARGERHGGTKLTTEQVREIRSLKGIVTQRKLAVRFGVDRSTIQNIQSRIYWRET